MIIPLLKFIYGKIVTQAIDPALLNEQLDATLAESEIERRNHNIVNNAVSETTADTIPIGNCIESKGKITSLDSEMVMIDNKYEYKLRSTSNLQFHLNQTVSYLLHRHSNDQMKIVKIEEIPKDQWDEEEAKEDLRDLKFERPEVFSTHRVIKMGVIVRKNKGGVVTVDVDGDERIDVFMDEVQADFQPLVGDQVSLTTIVKTDLGIVSECGKNVEVEKMEPTINKNITGTVTRVEGNEHGIIDNKYFFFWDALDENYRSVNRNDKPNEEKEYSFKATSKYFGSAREQFRIYFERIHPDAYNFSIDRFIEINVEDTKKLYAAIGTGMNVHKNRTFTYNVSTEDQRNVIRGEPIKKSPNFVKITFQTYEIPIALRKIVLGNFTRSTINEDLDSGWPFLRQPLIMSQYSQVFHRLLHLEEIEIFHAMRKYDREKVHFTREGEFLALTVLNIAETRPSLVFVSDFVIASCPWNPEKKHKYQGMIHKVLYNRVLLKFDGSFHAAYNCEDYKVRFEFSRGSLKKQHHAIDLLNKRRQFSENVLFPNKVLRKPMQLDVNLNRNDGELYLAEEHVPWFNKSLNIVQKEAVANILQGVARPMPYVIFGPPGTGKTITLIETILQIVKRISNSRIMVATPSNSSANLITERIIESGILERGDFLRLFSENSIEKEQIPEKILPYCGTIDIAREGTTKNEKKVTESGLKVDCSSKYLMQRRLLIGTCVTLGTLMQCEIPEEHFTHVIVDESGQCLETEIIIPMSFVDKDQGQIILAGDPMQLGPIVLSRFAADRGLDKSFLVRLLDQRPYLFDQDFENGYDPRLITRLIYNYRAMPSIMSVYSGLFYNNALKPMINDSDSEESKILARVASILPNYGDRDIKEGVIFIGVEGKNEQSIDSPSWFNMSESKSVFRFLLKLYQTGYDAKDIGIITPYTQQVKAIRALITEADLCVPKIGTVEEFQGLERQIILLSTVRSTYRQMQNDRVHSLGFVRSPKRMNVAISRARALLVVFGSPTLLSRDENWKVLITKCVEKKCSDNCNPTILNLKQNNSDDDEDDE